MGILLHVCTKHLLSTHEFLCAVPILQADLLARLVTLDNYKLLKQSFIISQTRAALTFPIYFYIHLPAASFQLWEISRDSVVSHEQRSLCDVYKNVEFHVTKLAVKCWLDSFFFILCRKSFKDFLKNDFKVALYNKIFEYVNNLESRLHHFHFTDMSNYTRVSLFKVLVLWFSLLFSALCSHSILTADLINYQMTVYKVFHRASFMRLIQVLNWAAAS